MLKIKPATVHEVLLLCAEAFETFKYPDGEALDQSLDGLCVVFETIMFHVSPEDDDYSGYDLHVLFKKIYNTPYDPFLTLGASYGERVLNYEVRARESKRIAEYVKTNYMRG